MKTMKVALLATAALAAVTVSARADDASAIKAQLEALNARIAQLEAAPAVPVGYSLLTISEGTSSAIPGLEVLNKDAVAAGSKATVIGIMPTADMPASTTIEWSGFVRAAILYHSYNDNLDPGAKDDYKGVDVFSRAQIKVVGKTDTAVGEVGVKVVLRGDFENVDTKAAVTSPEAWGYWAMTPELTLGGGYQGSLGNIGYGYDGACSCYYTDNADVAFNPGDASQMRLSYASGPMSAAIALEDATGPTSKSFTGDLHKLGVAGEIKYTGDTFNAEISGVWRGGHAGALGELHPFDDGTVAVKGSSSWQVGAGLGFSLGDMASLSLAGALGRTNYRSDFYGVSMLASANLSDTVHAELGAGYKSYDSKAAPTAGDFDTYAVQGGLYYDPVSQLTIGIEAEYTKTKQGNTPSFKSSLATVDLVTVFRF